MPISLAWLGSKALDPNNTNQDTRCINFVTTLPGFIWLSRFNSWGTNSNICSLVLINHSNLSIGFIHFAWAPLAELYEYHKDSLYSCPGYLQIWSQTTKHFSKNRLKRPTIFFVFNVSIGQSGVFCFLNPLNFYFLITIYMQSRVFSLAVLIHNRPFLFEFSQSFSWGFVYLCRYSYNVLINPGFVVWHWGRFLQGQMVNALLTKIHTNLIESLLLMWNSHTASQEWSIT